MTETPLTPTRQRFLKLCIVCLKRRENSIRGASAPGLQLSAYVSIGGREGQRRARIRARMRSRGVQPYAESLMRLRVKRSRFAAELEGLLW
jgi:hypothetical protein